MTPNHNKRGLSIFIALHTYWDQMSPILTREVYLVRCTRHTLPVPWLYMSAALHKYITKDPAMLLEYNNNMRSSTTNTLAVVIQSQVSNSQCTFDKGIWTPTIDKTFIVHARQTSNQSAASTRVAMDYGLCHSILPCIFTPCKSIPPSRTHITHNK